MSAVQPTSSQLAAQLDKMPVKNIAHIPGDYGLPVVGYTFEFLKDFQGLIKRKADQYGEVYRYSALFQNVINLMGPDANEFVLKDSDHNFSSKLAWDTVLEKIFPNGLMLRDFENHKLHRKILQAAFKKEAMVGYVDKMNAGLARGVETWPVGREFLFFYQIKALLLDTGAEIFLGLKLGKDAKKINEAFIHAVDAVLTVMKLPIPGTAWYKGVKGRAFLEKFIGSKVADKRKQGESNDFFSQVCHARGDTGEELSNQEVVDHMIFLLFAAHDTTTSTLTSIIYSLAKYPEWQDAVRNEMLGLGKDTISYDDLNTLEKTTWVFKESLRMYPALPTIPRRAVRDCEFKGYKIPKNASVGVHPLYTHFMEEYWTNPYQFDPARWSPERAEYKKHFYQWVPFGGGAHKCLGLNFAEIQTKIFLFHFLKRYTVSVKPGYEMPYQLVPLAMPKDGLPLRIQRR